MDLVKSHGLGNDYLVLDRWEPGVPAPAPGRALTAAAARALGDRHRGPGGDGVLEPVVAEGGYGLRIWNPDGSVAEKSGNGLRIFARFLVDHRGAPGEHVIVVPDGAVRAVVGPGIQGEVEMGRARFEPHLIPCVETLRDTPVEVLGTGLRLTAVGMGNPHCVVLRDDPPDVSLDDLPWRDWGRALENSTLFPNRTNVQVARVLGPHRAEARIWERGAGETLASGSSACAVAAAGVALGLLESPVEVEMPGGTLYVRMGADRAVALRGPVEEIGRISLSAEFVTNIRVIG